MARVTCLKKKTAATFRARKGEAGIGGSHRPASPLAPLVKVFFFFTLPFWAYLGIPHSDRT